MADEKPKTYDGKSTRLGGGGQFQRIADHAAEEYGSEEIGRRVAAAVGRRELGDKKMNQLAERGRARAEEKDEK